MLAGLFHKSIEMMPVHTFAACLIPHTTIAIPRCKQTTSPYRNRRDEGCHSTQCASYYTLVCAPSSQVAHGRICYSSGGPVMHTAMTANHTLLPCIHLELSQAVVQPGMTLSGHPWSRICHGSQHSPGMLAGICAEEAGCGLQEAGRL